MHAIATTPGALRLFAGSLIARLPAVMLSLGLLVHAQRLTGSFAVAGLVTGAYAAALGLGGPLLGRLVDRRGQTAVLLGSAAGCGAALFAIALVRVGAPGLVALAVAAGLCTPPVGACLRGLLPAILPPASLPSAYAAEAAASELTWIAGPPGILLAGALTSTGVALAAAAVLLFAATAAFACEPASRAWRPSGGERRPRGGSLRAGAMRTLVLVMALVGVVFGASEVGITATAHALGSTAAAGPLLGIWGAGSLLGGLVLARAGRGARLTPLLVGLGLGHLALASAGSVLALAAVLLVAGATIAPTYATVFALVDGAAPAGTVTEAFAWLNTAVAVGSAGGAAAAGALADATAPASVFLLAGAAGALAALASGVRARDAEPVRSPA
ncbi:MFS transporter [Candidatus Solirubrobacter pratensis]|uniref:MFS transporter n=1 Tax=Candidatus Solirubrobacter pratensis TaxID=1298857 RepID=UPI000412E935|nr:MFS transporter [Candidatus Solirubrobacter pratensis]